VSNTLAQILTLFPNKMVGHWPFSYAELLKWGFMMKMRATVAADEFMKATAYRAYDQVPTAKGHAPQSSPKACRVPELSGLLIAITVRL